MKRREKLMAGIFVASVCAVVAFVRPEGVVSGPPPPWRLGDDEEIVVELRVDASQAEWVRSLAGEETVAGTSPDGGADFKLPVTNRAAFRGFVLGLLDRAEVMGPPEVRDEIVYWLSDLAGQDGPLRRQVPSRAPEAGLSGEVARPGL